VPCRAVPVWIQSACAHIKAEIARFLLLLHRHHHHHRHHRRRRYSHKFKDSTTFNEEELLADLPPSMASNLMEKLYGKYVSDVPYFRGLDQVIIIRLAQAIKTLTAEKESLIMEEGKVGHEMFILIEG